MPYSDPEQRRDYHRQRQRRRREDGQCVNCSRSSLPGLTRCGVCRADHADRNARRGAIPRPPTASGQPRITAQAATGAPATAQTTDEMVLDREAEPSAFRLAVLLKANPKFQQSWDQNRRDMKAPSPSGYCRSLADIAIRAGWSDQEVVNLLICWRRIHGHDLKLRERYYDLTLTRAKEAIQMGREQEKLEETLTHPPEDEPEVLKDRLDRLFKVDIIRIVRYLGDPPDFYMYTEQGEITIGPIANLASQPKFREAVMAATSIVIPKVSGAVWETRVQAVLNMCEDADLGDASHPDNETRTWVHDYLIERYVRSQDEWEKATQRRSPFIKGDRIRIFLDDLRRWLDTEMGRKLDINILAQRLRRIKAETERIHLQVGGARTTRSVWVLPEIFQPPVVGTDPEDDGPDAAPSGERGQDATPPLGGGRLEASPPDRGGPDTKQADAGADNGEAVIQEAHPEHEDPPG